MDQADLERTVALLRREGTDNEQVEAKACGAGLSKGVWESVSAFANTHGGTLILGLSEPDGFAPAPGFDASRVIDQLVSGMGDGGSEAARLTNPPRYEVERRQLGDAEVVVVEVAELDLRQKPCFITRRGVQSGSYKRVADHDVRLSPTEIYELQQLLVPSDADRQPVPGASVDDLDQSLAGLLIANVRARHMKALRGVDDLPAQLRQLGITDARGGVTLAGLVACGSYPQRDLPSALVDVTVHAGTDKGVEGCTRFVDRELCEGPANECIEDAVTAVVRNLRTTAVMEGRYRRNVLELPEEVLREAIANAVMHREYAPAFLGQPVSVDVYADRVEVTNPGGLWGGKTLDNLGDGATRCRNPWLVRLMRLMPVAGEVGQGYLVERQGSGIALMRRSMAAAGLPAPEFADGVDQFRLVLRRRLVPGAGGATRTPGVSFGLSPLSSSQEAILATLSASVPKGVREVSNETGLSLAVVRAHMRGLVDRGLVLPTAPATSRNRRYLLAEGGGSLDLVRDFEVR